MSDDLPFGEPLTPANPAAPKPKCRRHHWYTGSLDPADEAVTICMLCGRIKNEAASKRGRNNGKRGRSDEIVVAAILGARAVGALKLPWDVEIDGYLRAQAKKLDSWPSLNVIASLIAAIPAGEHIRAVTLADTPGVGRRTTRYIVMPLDEFARWHGRTGQ